MRAFTSVVKAGVSTDNIFYTKNLLNLWLLNLIECLGESLFFLIYSSYVKLKTEIMFEYFFQLFNIIYIFS